MTAFVRDSARAGFLAYTRPLEGSISTMYLDDARPEPLVTIGDGALIDPVQRALGLAFVHRSDGSPATRAEIAAEWLRIKGKPELAKTGWREAQKLCTLMLTRETLESLTWERFDANVADLARRYPGFTSWPASGQLGCLSMAWALGSAFEIEFPKCAAALRRGDFQGAAEECTILRNEPRTLAQRALFEAAAAVVERGADLDVLFLTPDAVPGDQDAGPTHEAREAYARSVLDTQAALDEAARQGRR